MSREKQIEEMEKVIAEAFLEDYNIGCDPCTTTVAEALYNAGYRKMTTKFVLCPKGWQGVRQTRYYCPLCKKPTRDHERFCHNCGQAVKYPKLVYSKTENKNILDWSETI